MTACTAFSPKALVVQRWPSADMSKPANRFSPVPSRTGRNARCSSSIGRARRYCGIVATPPPRPTSLSFAACFARCSAQRISVGDQVKHRPAPHLDQIPCMMRQHEYRHVTGRFIAPPALARILRPGPRTGPNILRPRIHAPHSPFPGPPDRRPHPPNRPSCHASDSRCGCRKPLERFRSAFPKGIVQL
jgi:hypothetical protein